MLLTILSLFQILFKMDDVWLRQFVVVTLTLTLALSTKIVDGEKASSEISFPFSLYETFITEGKDIRKNFFAVKAKTTSPSAVRYGMTSLIDSRSQNFFDIDKETGELSTITEIDREFMSVHYFKVVATLEGTEKNAQQTATTTVQVRLLQSMIRSNKSEQKSEPFLDHLGPLGKT